VLVSGNDGEAHPLSGVAARGFDRAILDMNLHGEMAYSIADELLKERVPFIIATGCNSASLPERLAGLPRVEKPFQLDRVIAELRALAADDGLKP
jgi:DNA-binding response OmpR family regulator